MHKSTSSWRLEPNKFIQRAVDNMNKIASQKYGFSPDFVEEKTLNKDNLCEIYNFHKFENLLKDMNIVILNQIDSFVKNWEVHLKSVKKF